MDRYEPNWQGGIYNDKVYGIWAWTDVRAMWYWKDLLNQSGVSPESLKTWDMYIDSAKKINATLQDKGIQSMHLVAASHSPDMWYLISRCLEEIYLRKKQAILQLEEKKP